MLTKGLTKGLINKYSILHVAKYFSSGIFQSYLVYASAEKYFTFFALTTEIYSQKSNGMSEKSDENVTTIDQFLFQTG